MIPPIWFLEIHRINVKLGREPINQTEVDELKKLIEQGVLPGINLNDKTVSFDLLQFFIFLWAILKFKKK